ncbi:hypothetical protein MPLB_1680084 [Mesorhizobium sp. ORS 3324]|nr:hypothetical protein MPLB_1680084 [Mesorhizobium sp. ORS 3324]
MMVASSVSVIDGLYPNLEEVQGLRSHPILRTDTAAHRTEAVTRSVNSEPKVCLSA